MENFVITPAKGGWAFNTATKTFSEGGFEIALTGISDKMLWTLVINGAIARATSLTASLPDSERPAGKQRVFQIIASGAKDFPTRLESREERKARKEQEAILAERQTCFLAWSLACKDRGMPQTQITPETFTAVLQKLTKSHSLSVENNEVRVLFKQCLIQAAHEKIRSQ